MTFHEKVAATWLLFATAYGALMAAGVDGTDPAYAMGAIVLAGVYAKP